MAPPGKHVMSCFVQYAPYRLDPALGGWDNQREAFGDAVVNRIAEFAPDLPSKILHRNVRTPLDIERTTGPDRGQHLPGRALARAAVLQPARAGLGELQDPDQATCGCAAPPRIPGGGIMGANGRIAAMELLRTKRDGHELAS